MSHANNPLYKLIRYNLINTTKSENGILAFL